MTISMRFASLKRLEDVPYKRLGKPLLVGTQEHYLLYPEEKLTSVPSFKSIIEANITRKTQKKLGDTQDTYQRETA